MSGKFRALKAEEIDVRVAQVSEGKGCSLLLYKDARADMTILDEAVGSLNWQRRHTRENANCIVSIWDNDKGVWIEKEDTGTESNTEKEKGLASDSFKRACTNWGIGRELYTAPFIWISADKIDWYTKNGKQVPKTKFKVKAIDYTNGNITRLVISDDKGQELYTMGGTVANNTEMSVSTYKELQAEIHRTGTDINKLCAFYKVKALNELTEEQAQKALKQLAKKTTVNAGAE